MKIQDVMAAHRDDLAYHRLKSRLEQIATEIEDMTYNDMGVLKLRYVARVVTIQKKLAKLVADLD